MRAAKSTYCHPLVVAWDRRVGRDRAFETSRLLMFIRAIARPSQDAVVLLERGRWYEVRCTLVRGRK